MVFSLLLLTFALWFFFQQTREVSVKQVYLAFQNIPSYRLFFCFFLCMGSYVQLTVFDWLALKFINRALPYQKIALASFVGYSFSHNMGHPLLTGGYSRFRFYTSWGFKPAEIIRFILFYSMNFWMGILFVGGLVLTLNWVHPPPFLVRWFHVGPIWGEIFLGLLVLCGSLCIFHNRKFKIFSLDLHFPRFNLFLAQIAIASIEWVIASLAFYIILPATALPFGEFLGVYLFSILLGFISQVPGGLGVFESSMLLYLKPYIPVSELMASFLLFRLFYFILPFLVGIALYIHFGLFKRE